MGGLKSRMERTKERTDEMEQYKLYVLNNRTSGTCGITTKDLTLLSSESGKEGDKTGRVEKKIKNQEVMAGKFSDLENV